MLRPASHISAPPYFAVTVGPRSHSPAPMAEALITTPGPITARILRQPMRGASGSSPVFHRGMAWEPGWGAVNEASAVEELAKEGLGCGVQGSEARRLPLAVSAHKFFPGTWYRRTAASYRLRAIAPRIRCCSPPIL